MKRSYFGMSTSESFVIVKSESDREISNSSPENNFQSHSNNPDYLDLSSEETDKWKNTLSGKKRSSLFADVKTLEQDGCCSVAYEYLCRLEEFRRYLSFMLNTDLDSLPVNLAFEHQLSNGVWLCQLLEEVLPAKDIDSKIFDADHDTYKEEGLVYRHQQNICLFLDTIQELSFPDVLMPTPEEVFVNENRIKLVYTACALAYFLREIELANHKIDNLEKYLKFEEPVLVEIMTMLESKALDLPSFECLQSLVDDELIYQRLKFENTPLPSPSLSLQEKSYMTMKPSKHDNSSGDSGSESYYSNKAMEKGRVPKVYSGNYGPDGEPIYEDADKYIKSEVQVSGDFLDSFDSPPDPLLSSTFVSPSSSSQDNNPRRRKLSKTRLHAVPAWGSSQLTMFPSRLEFNLFTCRENTIRVCMYTKPKIDMIIPTSPSKGMPLNLKPQLEKLKQSVLSGSIEGMMDVLKCKHFQISSIEDSNSDLYLQALKLELEDSLNKCALAIYYGMKKAQSEKYLAQSEQGSFLLRVGKKTPPSLTFSFRNKRGIKHFKIQIKSNKLSLKKRDVLRHEYNFVEDLIRELVDFLQDAHKQTLSTCVTPDLAINPNLKECTFFTSLSFDKVQFCINAVHTRLEHSSPTKASINWIPPKENPYTGLWGKEMVIPVDRFAAELLLLQYGSVGSYIVRPKVEGPKRDNVISIRTENDVTHVKIVSGENGYSLPNSSDVTPSLEQFVEVFTFKESQLANISLKPVRIPTEKIEELKRKDEERKGSQTQASPVTQLAVVKKCNMKKGQSVEDLLKSLPPTFVHATMTTSSSGYEGDTDTLESTPPIPPPPFCPDQAFSPATSTTDISEHRVALPSLAAANERSCSFTALNSSLVIPEDSIIDSVTNFTDSFASCPVLQQPLSPTSPRKNVSQRVSAIHTPLPPVPIHSPKLNNKLKDSYPNTTPEVQDHLINEYDHAAAPPIPFRPHAMTKPTSEHDFKEIWRNQKPDGKSQRQRPLSIKMTSTIQEFYQPMPSSISTMDFSSQQRSDSELTRIRKSSVGSRPLNVNPIGPTNRYHTQIERKISTNLFPTQPIQSVLEDVPTPQPTPEPIQEPDAVEDDQPDIESWSIDEVGTWLEELGLSQYKSTFSDNDIDGSVLTMLTNENLKDDIGIVSFGHRTKILKQIKNLQK